MGPDDAGQRGATPHLRGGNDYVRLAAKKSKRRLQGCRTTLKPPVPLGAYSLGRSVARPVLFHDR